MIGAVAHSTSVDFVAGATALVCAAITLFFFRFWQRTRDRLFGAFGLAFAVFAANRVALSLVADDSEARTYIYVLRLVAFLLIALAILDKNRGGRNA